MLSIYLTGKKFYRTDKKPVAGSHCNPFTIHLLRHEKAFPKRGLIPNAPPIVKEVVKKRLPSNRCTGIREQIVDFLLASAQTQIENSP